MFYVVVFNVLCIYLYENTPNKDCVQSGGEISYKCIVSQFWRNFAGTDLQHQSGVSLLFSFKFRKTEEMYILILYHTLLHIWIFPLSGLCCQEIPVDIYRTSQ